VQKLNAVSLASLRGVGPRTMQSLVQANLDTVWGLLLSLPIRYEDKSFISPINKAQAGVAALFDGEVIKTWQQFAKRRMFCVKVADESSEITLRWFNFNSHQQKSFKTGMRVRFYGAPVLWQKHFEILHPELQLYAPDNPPELLKTLQAVYRTPPGVSQNKFRTLQDQALRMLEDNSFESACDPYFKDLPGMSAALLNLHRMPVDQCKLLQSGDHPAQKRIVQEELLAQLWFLRTCRTRKSDHESMRVKHCPQSKEKLLQQFGYSLTKDQASACDEICSDIQLKSPMRRLLQGDVGSGKTAVAALATIQVASNGLQSAWLAPTTVLAEQHALTLQKWFEPLGYKVACLTSSLAAKQKHEILDNLKNGNLLVVVGTHALFQESVIYKKLAFLVIDEQHRFGARQRGELHLKGLNPHSLSMTATPIPRTLMQSWFAGIASSQLKEKPCCRLPIVTSVVKSSARTQLLNRVRAACRAGGRVYWICSLIEASEESKVNAAVDVFAEIKRCFSDIKVGLIHGRMKSEEKNSVMSDFASGALQLLVATTVVEVGVDVPEATIIVIDNPERLGLTQLHQLRGRVGRSDLQSYCVLLAADDLSESSSNRLALLRESNDGFYLAEQDLLWRGPGQLLGAQQAGYFSFKVADLLRDAKLLPQVNRICEQLLLVPDQDYRQLFSAWLPGEEACLS
jgi:ATP-dependent DNA helicase RecG